MQLKKNYVISIKFFLSTIILPFLLAPLIPRHPVYCTYTCEVMPCKIQSVRFDIEKFLDNATLFRD